MGTRDFFEGWQMLKLRTLGGLSIENAISKGSAATQRRPLALLALLAIEGRGLSRDKIVALLWPESDAEHGRNSLSQVLSLLRRELALDDIVLGTTELRLNSAVLTCDVIEFEQRITADDLETAVSLYTGSFLDGVFLRNTPEFERWVDHERTRLQHVHGDALERLATRASAAGDHVSAVRFWRRRASLTTGDSRAALKLMESLVASGDPAGALEQYRVHTALLRDDLGLDPDAALVEFATTLRSRQSRPTDPPNALPGRIAALAAGGDAPSGPAQTDAAVRDESAPLEEHTATTAVPAKRKRILLPFAAAAVILAVATVTWGAKGGLFKPGPPKPPAHDSLRLRIVTTPVQSDPADSTLARGVRNSVLAELAQDPWLFVVTPQAWEGQAPFIGLNETVLSQPDTIRKYARKTRTHAIVDFGVSHVGNGFVITAEARAASTDSSLGVIAEAAAGPIDLPDAMARLGVALRERLVAARSTLPPTKWSLNTTDQPSQAIELWVEARSEASRRNFIEAARRAEAAVRVDSTFAQAWRLLHTSLVNAQLSVDDQLNAISAAFRFSNRVRAPAPRLDIVSAYYRAVGDPERSLVFYDSIARLTSVQSANTGLAYLALRRYDLATRVYRRFVDASHRRYITTEHPNFVGCLLYEGKIAEAKREVAWLMHTDSMHSATFLSRSNVFMVVRDWDSLSALGKAKLHSATSTTDSAFGVGWVRDAAMVRGQFAAFDSMVRLHATIVSGPGSSGDYLAGQLQRAQLRATVAGDTERAREIADSGLAVVHWESLRPMDRPYLAMLLYLASVGDVKRGAEMAREWSRITPTEFKLRDSLNVLVGRGELALASGDAREALRLLRIADVRDCQPCFYARYGRVFDAMAQRDSARLWFERYANAFTPRHPDPDATELAHTYRRLGELYAERGDARAAVTWYGRFTDLWATSDEPALQARVRAIRARMDTLRTLIR